MKTGASQGGIGEKMRNKRQDGVSYGREKVSFHLLKQMAISKQGKIRQKKQNKESGARKLENSEGKKILTGAEATSRGNQAAMSNELGDFGSQIGISWEKGSGAESMVREE
ncbi:hypothetical protein L6452_42349 [Arctium lappa]|uniref:Uncharacterized protein n=1 Tax=Arctium lappa TaxID=4217 RepID=A0ACB8XIL4_ARCLA|nr:hypothetical protein L6452_42349 [Arctium lappa]